MSHTLEYIIIVVYLLFLLSMGVILSRMNRNAGDYIRGGSQGTWWLVGTSAFMSTFSAYTFTANGSLAFESGPTALIIFIGVTSGQLIAAIWVGPWLRQTRAMTFMDVVRQRFGPAVEQFSLYFSLIAAPISASIQLWALAYFCSTVFGFDLKTMIFVLGGVVIFYSSKGGRWAVMSTDFIHGLILVPLTMLVAWLCFDKLGGFSGISDAFHRPDLAASFAFIKPNDAYPDGKFSALWCLAMFLIPFFNELSFAQAPKYLSVKDGREARYCGILSMCLIAMGGIIFLFPPMTARILYSEQVLNSTMSDPAQAAYATAAINLLPNGTLGILVIAMFSATLSSMDTGLNATTGVIVNNLIPPLRRRLKLAPLAPDRELKICKYVTVGLGLVIVTYAWLWANGKMSIFGAFTVFMTMVQIPLAFPFTLSLFIKGLPSWSYFFMVGCAMLPNAIQAIFGLSWRFQERVVIIFLSCTAGALISRLFYGASTPEFKKQVDALFVRMHTPIDFHTEVRENRDAFQLRLLGRTSLLAGAGLFLLLLVPNDFGSRLQVGFLGAFVSAIGALLLWAARRATAADPRK